RRPRRPRPPARRAGALRGPARGRARRRRPGVRRLRSRRERPGGAAPERRGGHRARRGRGRPGRMAARHARAVGWGLMSSLDGTVREWVGTCTDVTARVALERALAEERLLLQQVIEQAPAGVAVTWGPDHVYRLVNQWAFGLLPDDRPLLGRPHAEAIPETA